MILDMDWLSRYQVVIDCACRRVSIFTNNSPIIYQANQHSIRSSLILKSFIKDRRWLTTYGSLFVIDSEMRVGANYPRLHMVEEFLDIFLEDLPRLPLDREIMFCIDLAHRA